MNFNFRKTVLLMGACAMVGLAASPAYASSEAAPQAVQQSKTVTGTVSDAGGPVIGATIMEKGTSNGTVTDLDGNFSLNVQPGATLVISYVGYKTQEIAVGSQSVINIDLTEDADVLEEVVVVGYGVQKKKLVTGATVQVKGDDIAKQNTTNALGAMASSTPGVQITQNSSQPGKSYKVYIRGIGTTGDSQPLYVIDGVAGGNLDGINPADIESIDVLKDAASAAIYGARAANGVILVTTKQGKAGKVEITYNGAIGWSNAYKRPQLLNAQQFMTIMDEYNFNTSGVKTDFAAYVPQDILTKANSGWSGTDWWGKFSNDNGNSVGAINFNGGSLVRRSGVTGVLFSYSGTDSEAKWRKVTVNIMGGGLHFTDGGKDTIINRPLLNGTGGADGGVHVTGLGSDHIISITNVNTYTGGTTLSSGTLWALVNKSIPETGTITLTSGTLNFMVDSGCWELEEVRKRIANLSGTGGTACFYTSSGKSVTDPGTGMLIPIVLFSIINVFYFLLGSSLSIIYKKTTSNLSDGG